MMSGDIPPHLSSWLQDELKGTTLSLKGFWALTEFVNEFSQWISSHFAKFSSEEVQNRLYGTNQRALGWIETPEFGVAVTPVLWPNVTRFLNATGAGDYSSAVVAAYVWG